MAPHYQAATLIASPSYPNAIAWSRENLVAVASGHIVTILNPAALDGPRGFVLLRPNDPFPIEVVKREDLFEPCIVPTCLARDTEPCARSISWSQQGFAPNSGCLLAVCTVDGHVNLYRTPICEFRDEWVEVADISQLLFNHYKTINFGEDGGPNSIPQENANIEHAQEIGCTGELQEPLSCSGPGQRKKKHARFENYVYDEDEDDLDASKDANFLLNPCFKSKKASLKKGVKPGHKIAVVNGQGGSQNFEAALSCNGENKHLPLITAKQDPIIIGVLQAHNSWISAISWEVSFTDSSKPSLLLATGCSDGSVKIWSVNTKGLNQCTYVKEVSFSLLAEVSTDSSAPVSSISLSVPDQPQHEVNLAIGRVSGSLETWIWDPCQNKMENISACHAHDQVVTGLSWSSDGHCLYSCSQDNSARSWIFRKNHLEEIPAHTNFLELKESTDVRSLDPNLLDQMYQARTQKAVVEFIWIGGQFLGIPLDKGIHICSQQSAALSDTNFLWWGSNIFWSLKKNENGERGLALWDVIAALQVLKKSAPTFLAILMHKWVSGLFSEDVQWGSINIPYHSRNDMMSKVSSRKLHLLNIICRKVMLNNHAQYSPGEEMSNIASTDLWNDLLVSSERELRERLVAFTFAAVLNRRAYLLNGASNENRWFPVGIAQMDSWVSMNNEEVHYQLKSLRSRIKELGNSIDSVCENSVEETCADCSASVHFESPDVALCGGGDPATAPAERHKLLRCTASMCLCSVLQPTWYSYAVEEWLTSCCRRPSSPR